MCPAASSPSGTTRPLSHGRLAALRLAVIAAAGLAAVAGDADASGLETAGIGARGRSLGYALTAAADDWTAAYYNPAALAWAPGGTAAALYEYFTGGVSSSDSLRNLPPAAGPDPARGDFIDPVGDEPRSFDREDVRGVAHAAEAGGVFRAGRFGLAAGFYGSGAGSDWDDDLPTHDGGRVDASFSYRNIALNVPLAAGAEILPGLAAGAALTLRYGELDATLEKTRAGGAIPYVQRFEQDTSGVAASLDLGMQWRPGGQASLGAVVRLPYTIVKRGDTTLEQSLAGMRLERDTRVEETVPARVAFGASWRPLPGDLFVASAVWMNWSAYRRDTGYDDPVPGVLEESEGNPARWRDAWVLGAGWEHAFSRRWTGRLGLAYDQAPEPVSQRTLVGGQVVDAWKLTLGVAWTGERATLEAGYVRSWNDGVSGYLPGAEYRLSLHEVFAGASWRF